MDIWFGVRQPLHFVSKLTGFMIFSNVFSLFKLHFPHLQKGDNSTCPQGIVRIQPQRARGPDR